jgi:isopenicillin N synthase-like dioxygenase
MPMRLPVIDLSQGDSAASAIDAACRAHGFFYIVGHGVDDALIAAAFDASKRFFALDETTKNRWHIDRSGIRRGFDPIGWQVLDPGTPTDLKESFYIGVDRGADDPLVRAGTPNHGANQWPDEGSAPGFRAALRAYDAAVALLARRLMRLIALGLGLNGDHFERYLRDPMPVLRVLHYPPQPATAEPGQIGCGAHTDWGGITLLAQDDAGGLQVQAADGGWIEATPIPGSFVVNLGDMMQRWTNDRYRSTLHRVINRHGMERGGRHRYSIAYFFDIDYHAEVSALPGCFDAANPPRYPPITAGAHVVEMYARTHAEAMAPGVTA